MSTLAANPISRNELRKRADLLRKITGEDGLYFPVVEFIEHVLPNIFDDFALVILEERELKDQHGLTTPDEHVIRIRQDVYDRACAGYGRDRMTCAHEVGHLFVHQQEIMGFSRLDSNIKVPVYRDPEWQANAFAGELLMNHKLIKGLSVEEVVSKCGVSYKAAQIQLTKI